MKECLTLTDGVFAIVERERPLDDQLNPQGRYFVEHYRPNANGKLELLQTLEIENLVTNVAKNALLDTFFNSAGQTGPSGWYMGLIGSSGFSAIAATDTMASHAGWTEATGYTESTRPAWGPGAASGQITTNATAVVFTINTSFVAVGMFIVNQSTKGGTTGTLFSAGQFNTGNQTLANSDVLRVVYQIGM